MTDFERAVGARAAREVGKEQQDIFSLAVDQSIFVHSFAQLALSCTGSSQMPLPWAVKPIDLLVMVVVAQRWCSVRRGNR
ncbi:hypothetical protein [Bradyrhizobium sp. CIR3A]|nr:hypothetical protein [Bradyrhizobium sp. CIR3A]